MFENKKIFAVVPVYNIGNSIIEFISTMPDYIDKIYVVDDKCPLHTGKILSENLNGKKKLEILFNDKNLGVGGTVKKGYLAAIKDGGEIIIKIDGDGQMDANQIDRLIYPILNGYDYSLVGQVPHMPWAKAVYKGYNWDKTGSDIEGYNLSLEAQLVRGFILEYGRNKPDNQATEDFASVTFRYPSDHLTPTAVSHGITEYAFPVKNMKNEMLHKVRRTNNIITEKNMGGVYIARSN